MKTEYVEELNAINKYCKQCCKSDDVAKCDNEKCSLWEFRLGLDSDWAKENANS